MDKGAHTVSGAFDSAQAVARCRRYRRRILDISQQVSALHIAPAFSCLEIVDAVYHGLLGSKDIFILSKGHGCMIQYVILEERGDLSRADLDLYCKVGGRLGAHPDYGTPGIHASTGSLGHGMAIAAGQALAEKIKGSGITVYCVLSDGEFQEGSTWEAMMMAANLGLGNLVAVMDNNDTTSLERMSERHKAFYPLVEKGQAFGWQAAEVDGHDGGALVRAVRGRNGSQPMLVVGKTIKGKGVSYMENVPIWHYRSPNPDEYRQAIAEIEAAP